MSDIRILIEDACKPRPNLRIVANQAAEAVASYYGGELLFPFIFAFSQHERWDKLQWRRLATMRHYDNYVEQVSSKYVEGVFRTNEVTRTCGDTLLDEYFKNDYKNWFQQEFAPWALLMPELYVWIKFPELEELPANYGDQVEQGIKPVPTIIYPQWVRNYKVKPNGEFEWISFEIDEHIHILTEEVTIIKCINKKLEGSLEKVIPHNFGKVPMVRVAYRENMASKGNYGVTPYNDINRMVKGLFGNYYENTIGHAFMYNIIQLSIANLQYSSMLVEASYMHLFPKVVMNEDTAEAMKQNGTGASQIILERGGNNYVATRYLETPTMEIEHLSKIRYEYAPQAIAQAARLRDVPNSAPQSGIAKLMDAVPEHGVMSKIAQFLEMYDRKITQLIADGQLATQQRLPVNVSYPISFEMKGTQEIMQEATTLGSILSSGNLPSSITAAGELTKKIWRVSLPGIEPEMLKRIEGEIDAEVAKSLADKQAEQQAAKQAAIDAKKQPTPDQITPPEDLQPKPEQSGDEQPVEEKPMDEKISPLDTINAGKSKQQLPKPKGKTK